MWKDSVPLLLEVSQVSKAFKKRPSSGLFYDLFEKKNLKKKQETISTEISLTNISFELKAGEILGVLGKNGAGKSTLLRILSGIVTPTQGKITARAPITPVLDVGIAVHWDLNGLSNILLEGTALGWKLEDLQKALPHIIEYSGLENHLDKPIKHFSSGMLTRLSLATAFFRENSIFLLDEVFGAGDAQFREKTVETVIQKARSGSAFVVVAHNTDILKKICTRALYLEKGQLQFAGEVERALTLYYQK